MTESVILTVGGRQTDLGEDATTELIVPGAYYFRNGKHFVVYEETDPENGSVTGSTIKIAEDRVDVIRRGANKVHMVFEKEKQNITTYQTMAGNLVMDTYTEDIITEETRDRLVTTISYTLAMNDTFVSRCVVRIEIMSKDSARLHI